MATMIQKQDEDRSRSARDAATSQGTSQPEAMQRVTASPVASSSSLLGPLFPYFALSPVSMMRRMFEDFERMLDPLISGGVDRGRVLGIAWTPRMDVVQREGKLAVLVDLPGVSPGDVDVSVSDGELVIEGERTKEANVAPWHSERIYGRFRRVIELPDDIDTEAVEARFEHGVLEVSLPVQAEAGRTRRIEIRTAGPEAGSQVQAQVQAQPQVQAHPEAQAQAQGQAQAQPETLERESERDRLGASQESHPGAGGRS